MKVPRVDETVRESELLAADAVGDVIEHWGFRKALGRAWTVLFLSGEALPASALGELLLMSSGAVSMTLTELQRWGVVRRVWRPGERREFFEAETDFWKMISRVFDERERFLARSVRERLEQSVELLRGLPFAAETRTRIERVERLRAFAEMGEAVLDSFVTSQQVDFSVFGNLLPFRSRKPRRR